MGEVGLRLYLRSLKAALPYNFRYAEPADHGDTTLWVPGGEPTVDEALRVASAALPASWQITALLNYVIMYEEDQQYKSASRYYRAGEAVDQEPEKSAAPLTSEDLGDAE